MSTSDGHRHVVLSAVSLAGVYASPAKPVLAGVYTRCRFPLASEAGFLWILTGKASILIVYELYERACMVNGRIAGIWGGGANPAARV